jgi:hypothetical protein
MCTVHDRCQSISDNAGGTFAGIAVIPVGWYVHVSISTQGTITTAATMVCHRFQRNLGTICAAGLCGRAAGEHQPGADFGASAQPKIALCTRSPSRPASSSEIPVKRGRNWQNGAHKMRYQQKCICRARRFRNFRPLIPIVVRPWNQEV